MPEHQSPTSISIQAGVDMTVLDAQLALLHAYLVSIRKLGLEPTLSEKSRALVDRLGTDLLCGRTLSLRLTDGGRKFIRMPWLGAEFDQVLAELRACLEGAPDAYA